MKFEDVINGRHSVRKFREKKVPKTIIKKLIANGVKAPSACNRQPWIFYCVDSKKKRDEVSELLNNIYSKLRADKGIKSNRIRKVADEFYEDMGGAQNIIFVFRKAGKNDPAYVKPNDIASISCAVENIMLSAVEMKLGTCWIGTFGGDASVKKLRKILGNKKDEELVSAFTIGYPHKKFKKLKRSKKKVSEVLKFI